jgi:hypothetical protein
MISIIIPIVVSILQRHFCSKKRMRHVGYWPKVDIGYRTADVRFRGVKQTCLFALHVSADDPKRDSSYSMPPRHFPPPWSVEEHNDACFIVRDNNVAQLCVYLFRGTSRAAA